MSLASVRSFAELWMLNERARRSAALVIVQLHKPYTCYADESVQTNPRTGHEFYAATAYVATFESWIAIESEWRKILRHFGIPGLHMTDFMARQGEFKNDWSDQKRDRFIERLCTTVAERTIMGVGCAVAKHDYEAALPQDLREAWISPYYFCVYDTLSLINGSERRLRISLPKPLYFLFDSKKGFEGNALKLYREYQRLADPKEEVFGGIAFGSRDKYVPLQAADSLVHVVARRFREMADALPYKMKKPLDILDRHGNIVVAFPSEPILRKYIEFARRQSLSP